MFGFGGHSSGHGGDHGSADCHHAINDHNHAMSTLSDTAGRFIDSHIHSSHSNVYAAPATLGDVAQAATNAYGTSQTMTAACGD